MTFHALPPTFHAHPPTFHALPPTFHALPPTFHALPQVRALESFATLPLELLRGRLLPSEAVPLLAAYTALGLPPHNLLLALAADALAAPAAFHPCHLGTLA